MSNPPVEKVQKDENKKKEDALSFFSFEFIKKKSFSFRKIQSCQ